jgi:hypothetical protein
VKSGDLSAGEMVPLPEIAASKADWGKGGRKSSAGRYFTV